MHPGVLPVCPTRKVLDFPPSTSTTMMLVGERVSLVFSAQSCNLAYVAYVVDTGVNIKHEEFEGRAVWGATIPTGDEDEDGNGHGTHVAGTIGSKTYGVAKKAKIVAVKVLRSNGSGTMSDVLKGVEWAAEATEKEEEAEKKKGKKSTYKVY